MKISLIKKISIFLVGIITSTVFAEDLSNNNFLSDFVSRTWTAVDGLPGNTITSLMQDSTGYLYIGTYGGLVRFDGVSFTTINKNFAPKYNFISARTLFQDSKNNLWIGSNDEGITCILKDGTTQTFSMKNGLPNNSIRSICEDKDENIWVGTAAGLIYITKNEENRFEVVTPKGLEKFGDEKVLVTNLYCDTAGRIWISSNKVNGTYIYTNKSFEQFDGIREIENPSISYVTQDYSGAFWFGVTPHYVIKKMGTEEIVYDVGYGDQKGLLVTKIYQDKNANIWIGRDSGVSIIHDGKLSHFTQANGLADDKVADLIEDREGNMWFATDRGGVQKLSLSKFKTTQMKTTINAITEDTFRNVTWLGGDDGLYCVRDDEFIENKITELCKNIRIRHVGMTKDDELLISTYEKLGQVIVDKNGDIRTLKKENGLTGERVRVAIKSSDDRFFIGTTSGLNILEKDGTIKQITKDFGLSNDYIMCITETSDGKIWCGTDGGGIFSLENRNGKFELKETFTTNEGLAGNIIFKITELDEKLWVCTGSGISRIDLKDSKIFNYNSSNGLGSDGVFQMIQDYTGTIWMTSNMGIFCVKTDDMTKLAEGKLKNLQTRYFGKSDGLSSNGVTSTSLSMKDKLGRIWFTLIDGFAVYDPVKITANKTAPTVTIQEIMIDNEKYEWDGKTIELLPSVKRFGIKFTGISFVTSEQMRFSSKLDGFDKDFTEWTDSRNVTYTNLKPGTYYFSVITENGDNMKSEPSQAVKIIKRPYLWELIWFWLIVGILVIGTAGLIVFLRIRSLNMQNIILEKKVEERTHELKLEKERSEALLLNILPKEIAEELTAERDKTISKKYPNVTVLFTDIVGFTKISDKLSAETVVKMLNSLFTRFDIRAEKEGIEKIKTIGDSYMAAAGLTESDNNDGALRMINYAKGILQDLEDFNNTSDIKVSIRIGINTGNLVAGVIGKTKFIYDIWGDTVNTASRMESSGVAMKIHVSESTYNATKASFNFSAPVEVEVKGKGLMSTFYIV